MFAKKKLLESLKLELNARSEKKLLRILQSYNFSGIDFSSNDYLGLNHDKIILKFFHEICEKSEFEALGSTGSRLISGHRKSFEEVEEIFSRYVGVDDSLLFHSGYVANVSNIDALLSIRDYAVVDRLCHASILDGIRLSGAKKIYFQHNDLNHLEEVIQKKCKKTSHNQIWIFTESIFSMDGDISPIVEILEIARKYECNVFVDEAHSIGIYGDYGKGLIASLNLQSDVTLVQYPLGKAMGIMGCFASGDSLLKDYFINFSRGFIYSTSQPEIFPLIIKKIIEYQFTEEAEKRRQNVNQLSNFAREILYKEGFNIGNSNSHIIPIILGEEELVMKSVAILKEKNFNVVGIRPPTVPEGTSRIRLNIHAFNTLEEVHSFVHHLKNVIKRVS